MSGDRMENQNSSMKMFILIGFILSAIGIAGIGFWLSFQSSITTELPVLKADNMPIKVKPEDPGGKNIPHQDSVVLDILEGLIVTDNTTEKLSLSDAEPELPPVSVNQQKIMEKPQTNLIEKNKQSNTLSEDVLSPVLSSVSNPQDKAENKENMQDDLPVASNADATLNLTEIIENDTDAEEASINIKNNNDTQNVVDNKDDIAPIKKPTAPKKIMGEVTHKVQLAAFAKNEKAKQQAAILMEKHKDRLDGISLQVTKIDTGSSGIYWRVITQPLNEKLAYSTCEMLKLAGQDCIVRKIRQGS